LTTGELPFYLTYGTEAVILVEIGVLGWRTATPNDIQTNDENICEDFDFVEEIRN
jgi:hypothetical protein